MRSDSGSKKICLTRDNNITPLPHSGEKYFLLQYQILELKHPLQLSAEE